MFRTALTVAAAAAILLTGVGVAHADDPSVATQNPDEVIGRQIDGPHGEVCVVTDAALDLSCPAPATPTTSPTPSPAPAAVTGTPPAPAKPSQRRTEAASPLRTWAAAPGQAWRGYIGTFRAALGGDR